MQIKNLNLHEKSIIKMDLLKAIKEYLYIYFMFICLLLYTTGTNPKTERALQEASISKYTLLFVLVIIFSLLFLLVFYIHHHAIVKDFLQEQKIITTAIIKQKGLRTKSGGGYLKVYVVEDKKKLTISVNQEKYLLCEINETIEVEYFRHSNKVLSYQ
jgi:hypothetical protein